MNPFTYIHLLFKDSAEINAYIDHFVSYYQLIHIYYTSKYFESSVMSGCLGFNFWQGWEFLHSPIHNGSEVNQNPIYTAQDAFSLEVKELNWISTAMLLLRL
jgi:hypothetical protein